jgi:hypothetical protein
MNDVNATCLIGKILINRAQCSGVHKLVIEKFSIGSPTNDNLSRIVIEDKLGVVYTDMG